MTTLKNTISLEDMDLNDLTDHELIELEVGIEELYTDIEKTLSEIEETDRLIVGLENIDVNDAEIAKIRLESMFVFSEYGEKFKNQDVDEEFLASMIDRLRAGCEEEKAGLGAKFKKLMRDYLSAYGSRIRKLKDIREKLKGGASLASSVDMSSSIIGIATSDAPAKTDKDIAKNIENYVSTLTSFFDKWVPEYESNINKAADKMAGFYGSMNPSMYAEYTFIVLTAILDTTNPDKYFPLKKGLYSKSKEDRVSKILLGGLRFSETGHKVRISRGSNVDWPEVLAFSRDVSDFRWSSVKDTSTPPSSKIDISDIKALIAITDNAIRLLESTEKSLKNEILYPYFKMALKTGHLADEVRNPSNFNTPQSIVAYDLQAAIFKWKKNPKNDLLKNTLKVTGSVITFLNKAMK